MHVHSSFTNRQIYIMIAVCIMEEQSISQAPQAALDTTWTLLNLGRHQ